MMGAPVPTIQPIPKRKPKMACLGCGATAWLGGRCIYCKRPEGV